MYYKCFKKIRLNFKKLSKKSQVGTILTWFVAFLIIFFVMLIFIFGSATLAAQKKFGKDRDDIGFAKLNGDKAAIQRTFITLLEAEVENQRQFRDMILQFNDNGDLDNDLEDYLTSYINNSKYSCFIYQILSGDEELRVQALNDYGGRKFSGQNQILFLEKGVFIYLINENSKKTLITFYVGDCHV